MSIIRSADMIDVRRVGSYGLFDYSPVEMVKCDPWDERFTGWHQVEDSLGNLEYTDSPKGTEKSWKSVTDKTEEGQKGRREEEKKRREEEKKRRRVIEKRRREEERNGLFEEICVLVLYEGGNNYNIFIYSFHSFFLILTSSQLNPFDLLFSQSSLQLHGILPFTTT
ncbi:hypothetical protein EYC84_007120 [Monilinia fructicola]|uniref:Uncharacterized protein n=1 Tax=Monilinia fructicola TaxID=38448 RepID=A0A5M9K9C7_MONFR|nr:hypothetical protein EYC84_007120 [Monilinia fructicola]